MLDAYDTIPLRRDGREYYVYVILDIAQLLFCFGVIVGSRLLRERFKFHALLVVRIVD